MAKSSASHEMLTVSELAKVVPLSGEMTGTAKSYVTMPTATAPGSSAIVTTNDALVSSSAPPKDEAKAITCEFAPVTMFDWTKVALASSVLSVISATAFAGSAPPTVYSPAASPV